MRTGYDHSVEVVQRLILQSRICLSRALVSAQSAPWVCRTLRHLGDASAHFKAGHCGCQFQDHLGGDPLLVKFSSSMCPTWGHPAGLKKKSTDGCCLCRAWKCLEGPTCVPRPGGTSARLRAAQPEVFLDTPMPDAAYLGSVNL